MIKGRVYLDAPNIVFGDNVEISPNVHIFGPGKVIIGDNVVIGDGAVICSAEYVEIGNDVMIAAHCYIIDCNHGMRLGSPMNQQPMSIKPVCIKNDCWLGCGAAVLKGVVIGQGTVIGAHVVVSSETSKNNIVMSDQKLSYIERHV